MDQMIPRLTREIIKEMEKRLQERYRSARKIFTFLSFLWFNPLVILLEFMTSKNTALFTSFFIIISSGKLSLNKFIVLFKSGSPIEQLHQ